MLAGRAALSQVILLRRPSPPSRASLTPDLFRSCSARQAASSARVCHCAIVEATIRALRVQGTGSIAEEVYESATFSKVIGGWLWYRFNMMRGVGL